MLGQIDDRPIAVVVGVGEVEGEAARRLEPLDARGVAVARQETDARVAALVPEPREVRVGVLRLEGHGEVGDDDERPRERHVVDQRDVRQVDARPGRGAPGSVDRDVADRLRRLVRERVLLARQRIELRVAGEAGLERAVEIGPPDARKLVVELDRDAACLDDGAQLPAHVHQARVDVAVARALARSRDRRAPEDLRRVPIDDEAAAEPLGSTASQPEPVRHAGAREPVIAHQAHEVRPVRRIGPDPEEAADEFFGDAADDLEVEGRDLGLERREVPGDVGRAGAVRRRDVGDVVRDERLGGGRGGDEVGHGSLLRSCRDGYDFRNCLLYTSPSPRDGLLSRMPSSA